LVCISIDGRLDDLLDIVMQMDDPLVTNQFMIDCTYFVQADDLCYDYLNYGPLVDDPLDSYLDYGPLVDAHQDDAPLDGL